MGYIISYKNHGKREEQVLKRGRDMYRSFISSLQEKPANIYGVKEAEKLADQVLEIGGYDNTIGPIPIIEIAKQLGFTTFREKNLEKDVSGNIFVGGTTKEVYDTDKAVVVSDTEEYFHQRFIVAHELGHYLMNYIGSEDSKNPNVLFSRAYFKDKHNTKEEICADRFAAELLMPAKEFYKQYIKAMESYDHNRRYTISYLSNYFKTKKSSIERRIQELGIV